VFYSEGTTDLVRLLQQSAEENVLSWKDEVKEEGDSNATRNREFKLYVVFAVINSRRVKFVPHVANDT
jgi:hypothetical protein